MSKIRLLYFFLLVTGSILTSQSYAGGVNFVFTESNGHVFMKASGTLDTANLVAAPNRPTWGGVGIETGGGANSDIMGDSVAPGAPGESQDRWFAFHAGTDLSPWYGDMFTQNNYLWTRTAGTTEFGTYHQTSNSVNYPGLIVSSADLDGTLWTPDNQWEIAGTFESLGMNEGTYTITDAVTGEFISIQIVPEPASLGIIAFGSVALLRRRRNQPVAS
ncbi:MAG: PEP-CTERM sorting domain-containing protein [Phycisphaeraceae bacterium]